MSNKLDESHKSTPWLNSSDQSPTRKCKIDVFKWRSEGIRETESRPAINSLSLQTIYISDHEWCSVHMMTPLGLPTNQKKIPQPFPRHPTRGLIPGFGPSARFPSPCIASDHYPRSTCSYVQLEKTWFISCISGVNLSGLLLGQSECREPRRLLRPTFAPTLLGMNLVSAHKLIDITVKIQHNDTLSNFEIIWVYTNLPILVAQRSHSHASN